MLNDKKSSASRVFSLIKNEQSSSPIKLIDNQNITNFQINKDKKERGEFLKKLIQNEEEEEIQENSKNNYNVYSNPKTLFLNDKNDSYRNSIIQGSEKLINRYSNSKINSEEKNINLEKDEEFSDNNINNSEESNKGHKHKKKLSIKSSKKRNTHTLLIRNKSSKMALIKKMNNLDKLKNSIFSKLSIGNITYDDKEAEKNINNIFNNLDQNNEKVIIKETEKEIDNNIKNMNNNVAKSDAIKFTENKKTDKMEQLKIGDIVILINLFLNELNASNNKIDNLFNEGIVYPEIIVSKQLFCLPLSKLNDSHRCKSIFKRSLFRIETPQNYSYQHQFESLNNSYIKNNDNKNSLGSKELACLKLLSEKAMEEKKYNDSEFLLNYNRKILYGTIIQLRNIFTDELLTVDLDCLSKEIGCSDVVLNQIGGESSQFIFAPSNCLHNYGKPIFYNEPFIIIPSCLENNHFIHVKNKEDVKGNGFELNISRNKSIFKLLLFETAELSRKSSIKNEIKSTMVVKLYNTELKGFLSASIYNIDKVLPKLKANQKIKNYQLIEDNKSDSNKYSEENEDEENSEDYKKSMKTKIKNNIIYDNYLIKKGKKEITLNNSNICEKNDFKESYYKIILERNNEIPDNCLIYWEIQYEKPFEGKIINSESPIRFRNISSGLYLAYDHDKKEIFLSQKLNDNSIFYIYNEELEKNNKKFPIISEDQIYLRAKNTNMFLKAYENKDKNRCDLNLSKDNKIHHESFVFKIELQNNSLIQMNYNSNLIINHLINLYEQINVWGIKETKGPDFTKVLIYDYYTALQGEINFKKMINFYRAILIYIKNESIKAINNINIFINFQNYLSDQGLLFLLINFILLLDSKTLYNKEGKNGYVNIKEKAYPENIARRHIGDVIELSFSLLKTLIIHNSHSSKNIFNYLYLFDELLKYHLLETIEIFVICLKNTVSDSLNVSNYLNYSQEIISPNEANINIQKFNILTSTKYWIKKLKEIDEINNNILEQILYLKVLKRLCMNKDGTGNLKSQTEITKDLYKNDFFPLKFGIDINNNKPYVIFKVINDNEEFFIQNPTLNKIKIVNINNSNMQIFYYEDLKDEFGNFINYICAVLDLYYATCISENEINNHIITDSKNVGLTLQHIYSVITDKKINIKIRKKYLRLIRVLFINISQKEKISVNRLKIYIWNFEMNQESDIIQSIYKFNDIETKENNNKKVKNGKKTSVVKIDDNYFILKYYINNFFGDKDCFQNLIDENESNEGGVKFYKFLGYLEEILMLTKESLDFRLWNLKDLIILIQNINSFFIVFKYYRKKNKFFVIENEINNNEKNETEKNISKGEKENEIKKFIQNNLLARLVYYCLKSKNIKIKNRLYEIYDKLLDIYHIIFLIKEDCVKYAIMNDFKKWYNSGESLLNNFCIINLYNNFIQFEKSNYFCLDNKEKNYEILTDDYLFQILLLDEFNSEFIENQLFKKTFLMMINHLNKQNNMINELSKLEIIVNDEDLKLFESLIETHKFIKKKKQNIEIIQITKNTLFQKSDFLKKADKKNLTYEEKVKYNKNKDIATFIEDLANKIDSELIQKMKLVSNNKLNKMQNFCQILEIHKTLINLLQFLLSYEEKLNIYPKIFQFLFHFCYKNYINQRLLKSHFHFFLLLIPRFNYIEDVLMEILNQYKVTKKSSKFLMKIFKRIKELDLICPEVIKVLICMMFNNKKENIASNQIIILQNFFDILNDNAFSEFLEESKIIDYADKIKNKVNEFIQIEKEFQSYLNILEILSFTCINNKYCIINCRKILSVEEINTILKSYNYPYKLKTIILLFMKNVYYPFPSFDDIKIYDITLFFEIMENFILNLFFIFIAFIS